MTDHGGHSTAKQRPVEKEAEQEREKMKEQEDKVVVSSDDSFPASDPPSFNPGVTGASDVTKKKK
jgi:hypothetical protein